MEAICMKTINWLHGQRNEVSDGTITDLWPAEYTKSYVRRYMELFWVIKTGNFSEILN